MNMLPRMMVDQSALFTDDFVELFLQNGLLCGKVSSFIVTLFARGKVIASLHSYYYYYYYSYSSSS